MKIYKQTKSTINQQDILWCLSNLTAGSINHIFYFLSSEFYIIAKDLTKSDNSDLQFQKLKIFLNIICLDFYNISVRIIDEEFIFNIMEILKNENSKTQNKIVCLNILEKIFFLGNFIKKCKDVNKENNYIYNETYELFNKSDFDIKENGQNEYINFFLKNQGQNILNNLQYSSQDEIFKKVQKLIEKYFSFEDQLLILN